MKYYLSVPCVGCPDVSKDLKGQACLSAHSLFSIFMQFNLFLSLLLSKPFSYIDLERQRRANTWSLKQWISSAPWKQAFPDFPSLVKIQVGRGNI